MSQTAYDSWVHVQLEPDQVLRGNAKRYAPLHNAGSWLKEWEAYREAYITQHGLEAWEKLNEPVKPNIDNQ